MNEKTRGVERDENDRESVCLCSCHSEDPNTSTVMHFMACCAPPKTEEGRRSLAAYREKNP